MSGKKGMKHFSTGTRGELTNLREGGMNYREIGDKVGLSQKQVQKFFERQRRRERAIAAGWTPKPKGKPRNTPITAEERIRELEREVELLKAFLHAAGRRWGQR